MITIHCTFSSVRLLTVSSTHLYSIILLFSFAIFLLTAWPVCGSANDLEASHVQVAQKDLQQYQSVRRFITDNWKQLVRSHANLLDALADPKFPRPPDEPWRLYISHRESPPAVRAELGKSLDPAVLEQVNILQLPASQHIRIEAITAHGLLYLPYPYVVPGGRFNEMYGWDSYFIQIGLLRDGMIELAQSMTDNFVYEIEHYGMVLNANRTYYLTRSQPPFLTAMILGTYAHTGDEKWLRDTLAAIDTYYDYWTTGLHRVPGLALSRYHDLGQGPAPEVVASERDAAGRTHYDRVKDYYRTHEVTRYEESLYYDAGADTLTALFYLGDRAMRESGFDPSNRFGPFSVDIIRHAPVCLNSLLYRMEREAARIHDLVGQEAIAASWRDRAAARRDLINRTMWDAEAGLYFDYQFAQRRSSSYVFATTFYPLWVGLATEKQARQVAENLDLLEAPGGLLTSTTTSGSQWDAPYGWAPLQMIAVQGLRRYGFHTEANRLARKFLDLVAKEFHEHGIIVEKYDVVRQESDLADGLRFGYDANEIGFGWTNAVFSELLAELEESGGEE